MSAATPKPDRRRGVWIAYFADYSGMTPHSSEVAALRDAVGDSKQAIFVPFGVSLADAVNAAQEARRPATPRSGSGSNDLSDTPA